jgi:hypothetical protein
MVDPGAYLPCRLPHYLLGTPETMLKYMLLIIIVINVMSLMVFLFLQAGAVNRTSQEHSCKGSLPHKM